MGPTARNRLDLRFRPGGLTLRERLVDADLARTGHHTAP